MLRTGCMTPSRGSRSTMTEDLRLPQRNGLGATIRAALVSIPRGTTSTLVIKELMESRRIESTGRRPPSDRVRFGIIGIGMQGSDLLRNSIQLPGVECVAACDLYDGRHRLAKEIVGAGVSTTRRYQELLNNREIDCIVAAVPDHWHKKIVVATVLAGKDIYCEKPMSHS